LKQAKAQNAAFQMPSIDSRRLLNDMAAYQRPDRWRSIWQLLNTLIPYGILWYIAYRTLDYSFWLTLPIIVLIAGFLVRVFIIFHDCGHGSFFRSKKANNFWGMVTGVLMFTPYQYWRASHARHHATSGNLDKRGEGDIWMMTRREYLQAPWSERLKYRLYRNPAILFLLGPLEITLIKNRMAGKNADRSDRLSVYGTNCAIAVVTTAMFILVGWKAFLLIQFLALFLAHIAGVWLFYVQHQYEGVYWERDSEWDFVAASLKGGSFYKLPGIMRWFSGNIGYHHVHHLNSRIPNYNLPRCQVNIPALQQTRPVGIRLSLKSLAYRLWDEEAGKLISFRGIRRLHALPASTDANATMTNV
jgi:omega-6 fatty acid desaturase (delta-12 desaturase)